NVQDVTSPWNEATVSSAQTTGGSSASGSVSTSDDFVAVDITTLVQAWADKQNCTGGEANNGIQLTSTGANVTFDSKEINGYGPRLDITLADTGPTGPTGPTGATGPTGD